MAGSAAPSGQQADDGSGKISTIEGSAEFDWSQKPDNDPVKEFMEKVPEPYRGKEWVQNIAKSATPNLEEVFKQVDNLQKKLGERSAPTETATFDASLYEYKGLEADKFGDDKPLAEFINANRQPEVVKAMAAVFQQEGISPEKFQRILTQYETQEMAFRKAQIQDATRINTELETDFKGLAEKAFGNNAENAVKLGRKYVEQLLTPDEQKLLGIASNADLIAATLIANRMHQKYIKEDGLNTSNVSATSAMNLREKRMQLMEQREKTGTSDPRWEKLNEEINALNQEMIRMESGGRR